MKYSVGQEVMVTGEIGYIVMVDMTPEATQPYLVNFDRENPFYNWYEEEQLREIKEATE